VSAGVVVELAEVWTTDAAAVEVRTDEVAG
jgi:hypothetical protein